MKKCLLSMLLISSLFACAHKKANTTPDDSTDESKVAILNPEARQLSKRFRCPYEYQRIGYDSLSFGTYLRNLPLKKHGELVTLYDGTFKPNQGVYEAVVDLPIGKKNLHQCADAIMRLRAEYLWKQKRYSEIHFNLTNGFRVDYSEWMKGKRVAVEGNKTYWVQKRGASNTETNFWNYLEFVFTYAGTLSLSQELVKVSIPNMQIGDVFIKGGSPGHAILVVDMAKHPKTGDVIFMLAQSYMPAQQIQILKNNNNKTQNPWYSVRQIRDRLVTPEWSFRRHDLKRFQKE